jgi:hypothetical protein
VWRASPAPHWRRASCLGPYPKEGIPGYPKPGSGTARWVFPTPYSSGIKHGYHVTAARAPHLCGSGGGGVSGISCERGMAAVPRTPLAPQHSTGGTTRTLQCAINVQSMCNAQLLEKLCVCNSGARRTLFLAGLRALYHSFDPPSHIHLPRAHEFPLVLRRRTQAQPSRRGAGDQGLASK